LIYKLKNSILSTQWGCNGFDCWIVQSRVAGGAALTPGQTILTAEDNNSYALAA